MADTPKVNSCTTTDAIFSPLAFPTASGSVCFSLRLFVHPEVPSITKAIWPAGGRLRIEETGRITTIPVEPHA